MTSPAAGEGQEQFVAAARAAGVDRLRDLGYAVADRTLLRENLKLSVAERFQKLLEI